MTSKPKRQLRQDELDQQNGETLPERELMSTISFEPESLEFAALDRRDELVHIPEDPEDHT